MNHRYFVFFAPVLLFPLPYAASQTTAPSLAASAPTPVPALVPYSGLVDISKGQTHSGEASITFLIYKDEQGGEALYTETQTVLLDPAGHFEAHLGAANPAGLPADLFSSGEARWLEVQVAGEKPRARTLLASVPYAMKASDAATLGGLPASAFALAGASPTANGPVPTILPNVASGVTTTGGSAGYVPQFSGATSIVNSPIFVKNGNVGIGTINPFAALHVSGKTVLQGKTTLLQSGVATASAGANSQPLALYAASYNASSKASTTPYLQLQAEPSGNNTSIPSASLNFLSSNGTAAPAETGLYFNSNGLIHFAPGQTFPGTGQGTITGVTAGTGLTGGGSSGSITLNLNTAQVPRLGTANTFAASQSIATGDLNLPGTAGANSGVLNLGGIPFLHSYPSQARNTFVGGAGNFTTYGGFTTGVGYAALAAQSTGGDNTAVGTQALYQATTGSGNTGVGVNALALSLTGNYNTALGFEAGVPANGADLQNTTTLGANATATQGNSLILGNTVPFQPGRQHVNVGIGTSAPRSILEAAVSAASALGPVLTLTNSAGGSGSAAALDFNTYQESDPGYNPAARIEAVDDGQYSNNLVFLSNVPGSQNAGLRTNMTIASNGHVGLGTPEELISSQMQIVADAGRALALGAFGSQGGDSGNGGAGLYVDGGDSSSGLAGTGIYAAGGSTDSGVPGYGIYAVGGYPGSGKNPADKIAAGFFNGDVRVIGALVAATKNFQIDHPVDPANRYLVHASVESSEMMNIYSGNVTTDELGLATVTLPEWFQAENGDFRYQLTVLGGRFAQAIVSKEIENNQFTISTNATNVKVSWQVTAVRQDAYAKAHPLVVEPEKPAGERGFYQNPELYGQPEEKQTEWARHPEQMQRMKAMREAQKSKTRSGSGNGPQARTGPPPIASVTPRGN